jgi:hypothetical protein
MLRHQTDLDGNDIYIGETIFEGSNFTRLIPYAIARADGWHIVDRDSFPEEGSVFSVDTQVIRKPKGYVVLFTKKWNDRPGGKDRYITTEIDEAIELAHSLVRLSTGDRRNIIMSEGIDRGSQEEPSMLVPSDDARVAFPRLQRSGPMGRWTLSLQENADRIRVYEAPADFDLITIDGRKFLLPGRLPTAAVGHVNWQTDGEFLQTLLKRLRRITQQRSGTDDFILTEKLLNKLRSLLRDGELIGEFAGANDAARERLGEFLANLDREAGAATAIADALFADEAIRSGLTKLSEEEADAIRLREIECIRPEIVTEVEATIKDRLLELETLSAEIVDAKSSLAAKSVELQRVEGLVQAGVAGLSASLGDIMKDIRETGRTLSQIMEVTGASAPTAVQGPATVAIQDAPWSNPRRHEVRAIAIKDLPEIARTAAASSGLDEEFIRRMDILARAGEIPVVVGNSAELLLGCYASVVAAGGLVRMPLDPSVLGPEDLWRRAGSGTATPLALAWQSAIADVAKVQIVCLDDVDRASLSEWFARFKSLYRSNRPDNLLLVATLSPGTLEMPLDATERGLHPSIVANVKTDALSAIVSGGGIDAAGLRYLSGPTRAVLTASDRRSLLAKAAGSGIEGGDAAHRLLAIHSSALTWLDPGKACDFAVRVLLPSKIDSVVAPSEPVSEIHAERKTQ